MSVLYVTALFIAGVIFGSFINALVWRLSMQLNKKGEPKKLSAKKKAELSIVRGHSMCPACKHRLAAKDLIPVFSWLALKGRCRYCQNPISAEYPAVELLVGVLFAVSYIFWPIVLSGAEWIVFGGFLATLVCLIALAIYDIKQFILPTKLIYIAGGLYVVALLIYSVVASDFDRFGWAILAAVIFWAIFAAIFYTSLYARKRKWTSTDWLGYGDVRLVFVLGLLVGDPLLVFVALFLASITGVVVALPGLLTKKVGFASKIPFGPYLIVGTLATVWWGSAIVAWYTTSVLGL